MSDKSFIHYDGAEQQYFADRALKRYAGVWSLWALGVGAVISGDFFGWNFGLTAGGFGGLLIATLIITVMYAGLCFSLAEMSPALPHTGGAYSFGRTALGPWGGFIAGLAENMEYVLTPAVIVVGIGGYLGSIAHQLTGFDIAAPIWWAFSYLIFVGLNIWGVEITFKFSVVITFIALAILMLFWVSAIGSFDLSYALNIEPSSADYSVWLPNGVMGIAAALPFAIWFYLAIEQLPLAAEECHEPEKNMPKGILWGLLTLIIAAFLTLILNAGIAPGAKAVGESDEPLFLAFNTLYGEQIAPYLALIAVAGLIASFHSIIFAYGRNIFSLSRAGYFPRWLSVTHKSRQTPHIALICGAIIGFIVALIIEYTPKQASVPVGAILLNMAVFGAIIAYIIQLICFIRLRTHFSHIDRPYQSPLGITGAVIALVIATLTLLFLFLNEDYVNGIYGCAVWFLLGILYFALWGRKHLVYAPEEAFARNAQPPPPQ